MISTITNIFYFITNNQIIESNISHIYKTNFRYDKTGNFEKSKMPIMIPEQTEVKKKQPNQKITRR